MVLFQTCDCGANIKFKMATTTEHILNTEPYVRDMQTTSHQKRCNTFKSIHSQIQS